MDHRQVEANPQGFEFGPSVGDSPPGESRAAVDAAFGGLLDSTAMTVVDWLLDSDPAIRWQALRDLVHAPETDVSAARARIAHEGWGARLLELQDPDGQRRAVARASPGGYFDRAGR